jgi:cytochrome c-type biogenesis protein CcmH
MKRALLIACLALLSFAASAKEAVPLADDVAVEARLVGIADELRCLVCQNESLASSHAELAEALRNEVRRLIREGKSDAEVKQFLVARYGDFVLYQPPFKASTLLLWVGPGLLLLLGFGGLVRTLRRRAAVLKASEATDLSEADRARADALLQAKDPQ